MFIEFAAVDWWFIFNNSLWILGAAIVLITFSYHEYLVSRKKVKFLDILKTLSFKKYSILGLTLVVAGLSLSEINLGRKGLLKYIFVDYNVYDLRKIKALEFYQSKSFQNNELEMNIRNSTEDKFEYPIEKGLVVMAWNGYVGTPFLKLQKGNYIFEFEARGSKADNEYAKTLVFFVVLKRRMLTVQKLIEPQELSEEMRMYSFKFEVKKEEVGKIRIQFINDRVDDKGRDRNVWIRGVKISRVDD